MLATLRLGATVTGLNPASTDSEVLVQLDDADACAIVTTPGLVDQSTCARPPPSGRRRRRSRLRSRCRQLLACTADVPDDEVDCDSVAVLPYSSGTTGLPKGVMLTHRQLVTACRQIARSFDADAHDVTLAVAPWFHILGMTAELLVPLTVGATVVTMPRFDPAGFLEAIERHRVTYVAVPPPVASFLAHHPSVAEHDLGSLELLASGGAPLPRGDARGARPPPPALRRRPGLGTHRDERRDQRAPPPWRHPARARSARCCPTPSCASSTPIAATCSASGETGELQARGPQTMLGYLNRPDATAEMITPDGWVRTGDLGRVDPDGNIVVVDRLKELIKVNAFQVAPAEVEAVIVGHPAVADVAVVGAPDPRTGETPVAFVVADRRRSTPTT